MATSLIEAGVDISFPEVWRASAGLDSIAQAAGRCNREGELLPELGRVVVFRPASASASVPRSLLAFQQAAQPILRDAANPLAPDAIASYFRLLYAQKGMAALDSTKIGDQPGILDAITRSGPLRTPFETIADAFRMIDETMRPVLVPWQGGEAVLKQLAEPNADLRPLLRVLQRYTVGIPGKAWLDWVQRGDLVPVTRELGDTIVRLKDLLLYKPSTGLDLSDEKYRSAEQNIF